MGRSRELLLSWCSQVSEVGAFGGSRRCCVCLLIVWVLAGGCSVLIKEGYNVTPSKAYDWEDVARVQTQAEAVHQFGSPSSALPCPDGWQLASYRLPSKTRQPLLVSGEEYDATKDAAETALILASDFFTFGLAELGWSSAAIYQVVQRNRQRPEFWATLLYTPDGQVLYRMEGRNDPGMCAH